MNTFSFKMVITTPDEVTEEQVTKSLISALRYSDSLYEDWNLSPLNAKSGPRMEIVHHDDEPKCIRVFDDYDPICDVFEDGNVVFLASSTDAKDMQLVVNIAANFNFFYNSL